MQTAAWRPLTGTAPVSRKNVAQNTHRQSAYLEVECLSALSSYMHRRSCRLAQRTVIVQTWYRWKSPEAFLHRFNVIYNSFGANLMLHTHSMYIYLLIRYHCNVALPVLHFVNFDNFLTFPNRKILHVKHNSGWNFKRVTSKTVQTNANTLSNVSTLRCQSDRLATGGGNQPECWNSKTSCSFAGEET